MKIEDIKHVTVIGAGAMGRQIAMNTALNGRKEGYQVVLTDSFEQAVDSAKAWAAEYLNGRVDKGRITQEEADIVSARLTFTTDVDAGVKDADLVVEAIIEDLEIKKELFGRISKIVKADTILATNSSNLVSSKLAEVTEHPDRLMNLHYFNPALVMKLVEVVKGPHTSDEAAECARAFGERTGKSPILIQKEIAGFVANRINAAVTREACLLLEKDIDTACEKGLGYPMGPFKLMDMTGLDVNYYVRRDRFAESGDPNDAPSPLVIDKVIKGEFGRKTGKGWYDYSDGE
jgi:3-hydroxybutyryl-CoA dehydrogenase